MKFLLYMNNSEKSKPRVIMLIGSGNSSRMMYHGIKDHCDITQVIIENKPSSLKIIRRRIKKLGFLTVIGQLSFILINKVLSRLSKPRILKLMRTYQLNSEEIPEELITRIKSVNSKKTVKILRQINPDAIVVNGTRIIRRSILNSIDAHFINTHVGITPKYRGVHGGYWALANKDKENCGVTVHLVDQGIDTGGILYQSTISVGRKDNFNTYPIHQIAKAIPLMINAVNDVFSGEIRIKKGELSSKLYYHPTIIQYLYYRFIYGIK